jgi:DNA (cytosine-5)-methyltransferase 1
MSHWISGGACGPIHRFLVFLPRPWERLQKFMTSDILVVWNFFTDITVVSGSECRTTRCTLTPEGERLKPLAVKTARIQMSQLNAIDLFCGCGGMSLGAARAGFKLALAVDNDSRALASHSRNFPNSRHSSRDLSRTSGSVLLNLAGLKHGQVDALIGGPPCQGFSSIGRRNHSDPRNQMLNHFFRLVTEINPSIFVIENVPGILGDKYRDILQSAESLVTSEYTLLAPYHLRAVDAGAPTVRTRVVIVGFRNRLAVDAKKFWQHDGLREAAPAVRQALDGLPADIHPDPDSSRFGQRTVRVTRQGSFFEAATGRIPAGLGDARALNDYKHRGLVSGCIGTRHSHEQQKRYAALQYGKSDPATKSVKLDPGGYCPTLRAGTGPDRGSFQAVRPIHYLRPRVITPREAARLQGFPDWYQFDRTKWHTFRQLGNSVSPLVSEFIMKRVARVLTNG